MNGEYRARFLQDVASIRDALDACADGGELSALMDELKVSYDPAYAEGWVYRDWYAEPDMTYIGFGDEDTMPYVEALSVDEHMNTVRETYAVGNENVGQWLREWFATVCEREE